jgi:hypothetical protein
MVHGTVHKASLQRSVSGFEGIVSREEYFTKVTNIESVRFIRALTIVTSFGCLIVKEITENIQFFFFMFLSNHNYRFLPVYHSLKITNYFEVTIL